jgi:ABC-type glutathione transport system ATPase component
MDLPRFGTALSLCRGFYRAGQNALKLGTQNHARCFAAAIASVFRRPVSSPPAKWRSRRPSMRPSAGDGREGASAAVLRTESLTVRFGGLTALDNVDFAIARGEIRAIIGPNGAGKSTFFNCLTGVLRPSTGRILFNGEDITGLSPNRVSQKGDRDVLPLHHAALLIKSYDGQSAFH